MYKYVYNFNIPVNQGDLKPDDAANMLTIYEGKFTRLKEDRDNLLKAKEALELADPGIMSVCCISEDLP